MNIRKLNGWQRLWVLLSIIYFVVVLLLTVALYPSRSGYEELRVLKSLDLVGKYLERNNKGYKYEGAWVTKLKYFKNYTDEQIISRLHSKFKGKVDFTRIEKVYLHDKDNYWKYELMYLGVMLLVWVLPISLIYLLGLGIKWVIRGFKDA